MLDIPRNWITYVEIKNVELPPEEIGQKFSRLDLNLIVDGRKVNIEMQVNKEAAYKERTLFSGRSCTVKIWNRAQTTVNSARRFA